MQSMCRSKEEDTVPGDTARSQVKQGERCKHIREGDVAEDEKAEKEKEKAYASDARTYSMTRPCLSSHAAATAATVIVNQAYAHACANEV